MSQVTQAQQSARPSSQQQQQQQQQQQSQAPILPPLQTQIPPTGSLGRTATFDTALSGGPNNPSQTLFPPSIQSARPSSGMGHERSYSHGAMLTQSNVQPQQTFNSRNSTQFLPQQNRFNGGISSPLTSQSGPPQLGALSFQTQPSQPESPQQGGSSAFGASLPQQELATRPASPPNTFRSPSAGGKQVFGVTLARLYERDQFAVPMVVHQCIQAVDLYGLAVEGIYRLSGSAMHVNKLKNLFDTSSWSPPTSLLTKRID